MPAMFFVTMLSVCSPGINPLSRIEVLSAISSLHAPLSSRYLYAENCGPASVIVTSRPRIDDGRPATIGPADIDAPRIATSSAGTRSTFALVIAELFRNRGSALELAGPG